MKIMIVAGGTGGHLFPAIRLSEEIKLRQLGEVLFVTSSRRQDMDILREKDIRFKTVPVIGIGSRTPIPLLNFIVRLISGTIKSIILLLRFRPFAVIGFGGYVTGPLLLAAALLRTRTLIHEQNVYPGKTNRILAGFVDKIAISFPDTGRYLKKLKSKIVITGNPLQRGLKRGYRKGCASFTPLDSKHLTGFTILAMGGSQGAGVLNKFIPEAVRLMQENKKESLELIHISGHNEKDEVIKSYDKTGIRNRVLAFTSQMPGLYNESDFVIARGGATTVAELLYLAKPSILIPYPHAGGHQRYNAKVMEDIGLGILLEEKDLTPGLLRDAMERLMDKDLLASMSSKVKGIDSDSACDILIKEILRWKTV